MCRLLAYQGEPILLEQLLTAPRHSLIQQSQHAHEGKAAINGDGCGVGWYGERTAPGLYRQARPAWTDENLHSIAAQIRSSLFFAHVRAATGTPAARENCHPFAHGRLLFMHDGQVGDWQRVRRRVEAMIPDALYPSRIGTTDSEALFLAAIGRGLEHDPVQAFEATLAEVARLMREAEIDEPLRFGATVTDGDTLWAFRWSSDAQAPSMYYKPQPGGVLLVSEPIDGARSTWLEVPQGGTLISRRGRALEVSCGGSELLRAA